jgi:MFS transporter, ACS family, tartrate transporter
MSEHHYEISALRKIKRRFVPLLFLCFVVAFLDRVNIGFAALTMNQDLGLSATAYGLGAGLFFLTYFIFELPSNLALERFGARRWIARIMLTWGLLSGAMAFVQGETSYYILRLLLGAAEAGFFPGVIFFLSLWVPASQRGAILATFMVGNPVASVVGAPLSGLLMQLDGMGGLKGWQWMFMIEAIPALVLAWVVLRILRDHPDDAEWLSAEERTCLKARLAADIAQNRHHLEHPTILQLMCSPLVVSLAIVYFGMTGFIYGLAFFMPQIVRQFGLTIVETGFVSAIPFVVGALGSIWWGWHSDRRGERRLHLLVPLGLAIIGLAGSTIVAAPVGKLLLISVAALGIYSALVIFWTSSTALIPPTAAAAGIALVNSFGNLSGFVNPLLVGAIRDLTGSFSGGLQLICGFGLIALAILVKLTSGNRLDAHPRLYQPGILR